jgi:UDP-glucuronate 4-epimerase
MKVLITGTAGFIGSHLAQRLLKEGFEVIGLDCINDYYDVNLKYDRLENAGILKNEIADSKITQSNKFDKYRFVKIKLEDKVSLDNLFKNEEFDYVVNLAAQAGVRYSIDNPYAYIDSNVIGFINILEACRHNKIKHLVYASSSSVYGLNEQIPFSTSACTDHPMSLYAATKKANELMAHTYSQLYNLPTTGLRFFTVYGPWGRPDMALFLFAEAIRKGEPINVFNHGNMSRDFTYVDDIVTGVVNVILNPAQAPENKSELNPTKAPYKIYNIGNNNPVKLMDFIQAIEDAFGGKFKMNMMKLQPGDVPSTFANVDNLVRDFNYKPNTSIKTGIEKFISWYKEYYKVNT